DDGHGPGETVCEVDCAVERRTLSASLDLRFLELDVLAHLRVVLLEAQLFGLGARILLGHVEEARVGAADELDLDGCRLGHGSIPNPEKKESGQSPLAWRAPRLSGPILSTDRGS